MFHKRMNLFKLVTFIFVNFLEIYDTVNFCFENLFTINYKTFNIKPFLYFSMKLFYKIKPVLETFVKKMHFVRVDSNVSQ